MSWLTTARSLLRDLKRTKSSSPSELQLERLHVEIYESDKQVDLSNINFVGDFIRGENCRAEKHCMEVVLRNAKSAQFCSDYVSSLLVSWSIALSQQATDKLNVTRNHKLRIKNDTYSGGASSEMTMSLSHEVKSTAPFLSVIIRERHRPDSSISSAELYFILAMAAAHHKPLRDERINVRVLVVYSFWVQSLDIKTTSTYIASIIQGWECIVDHIEIRQTPWFNFLDVGGQLQVLLSAFEGINLGPEKAAKVRMPLQGMKLNAPRKRSNRKPVSREESRSKRQKSHGQ